jgi:hypothetical protein
MKTKHTLCMPIIVAGLLLAPASIACAETTSATVIRVCAKNLSTAATCWLLQKGGEWVIDKAFTDVWLRITGTPSAPDTSSGGKAQAPPQSAGGTVVATSVGARAEPLDATRLQVMSKGKTSAPAWLAEPGANGVIVYAPPDWSSRLRTPAVRDQIDALLKPHGGSGAAQTAAPTSSAALVNEMMRRPPCHLELEAKLGLSLNAIFLAPPAQRTTLLQRRQLQVLDACAKRP